MSFAAVRGQEKALAQLTSSMREGRLEGAYLWSGPAGVGKHLAAVQLAKALNCLNGKGDSCDACAPCAKIDKGTHPDVHCIDAPEEEILIDDIRSVQKEMSLRPYEGKKKVFILCNAHKLNNHSASALLKTLEEPAKDSLIVLITEKPAVLLKTIISRCKIIRFPPLPRHALKLILSNEYGIEAGEAHFLAHYCEGSMGRALTLRAQDIMRRKNAVIDEFARPSKARAPSGEDAAKDARFQWNILASWLRDLFLLNTGAAGANELIHADRKEELMRWQRRFSQAELEEAFQQVSSSLGYLDRHINVHLLRANIKWQFMK